ncbi:serine carboxypeptidase-like 33 [Chenopodium quinoa]|uniref:serine carboxypeptidase-like 33 n=1 Tax=Chenopodium quinoa TaxID=63459 RepID=UPI000B791EED|nr:serine carboxypeptidase-like 33 [Chenopodium quinoa]
MMSSITKIFSFLILLVFYITLIKASETFAVSEEDDSKILNLPGQPSNPPISQYSGYITVNQNNGRALFYWFFEALSQLSDKPLLLWLNGGPGCSSVGYGALVELGPLKVDENGVGLLFNNFSWITEANLLFVESPVGVGFSYTNTSSDLTKLDDKFVAEDAYIFLVNWLGKYPQFKNRDFFLAGESYAGHYVPQLAELIFDRNKDQTKYLKINLKGFLVGNPETDDFYDSKGLLEYAWSHTVITDDMYNKTKEVCDFKTLYWPKECVTAMNLVYGKYKEIDFYNIYAPICLSNSTSSQAYYTNKEENYGLRRPRIYSGGYDPCYSNYAETYFNRADVQASLRANVNRGTSNTSVKWNVCNDNILNTYNATVQSVLPIYKKLIQGGLKIWVYSGDVDGRVPVIGTRYWVESLGLPIKTPWRSWYHQHQVGGRLVEYEGLTLVTVRGAGHLVPLNKPSEALALIHSFLTGEDLLAKR